MSAQRRHLGDPDGRMSEYAPLRAKIAAASRRRRSSCAAVAAAANATGVSVAGGAASS